MWFGFYTTESFDFGRVVGRTLETCRSLSGCEPGPPGETITATDFSADEGGAFELYWQDGPGRVSVGFKNGLFPNYFIRISIWRRIFVPDGDEERYEGLTDAVIKLIQALANKFDPYYVMSPNPEPGFGPDPTDVIPMTAGFELERIPWFGIYSEPLIDTLGGREHVLNTPAWHVKELDTGSVLLIRTRAPWAKLGHDHPVDHHLLGEDA